MKVIDILVVSDEWIARTGLKHLLAPAPGFQLVGEALQTSAALQQATKLKPDVIVFHATEHDSQISSHLVTQTSKRARTVLVGGEIHRIHLGSLLAAGALGYVELEAGPQELFGAIRAAAKGHRFIDPGVSDDLFELFVTQRWRSQTAKPSRTASPSDARFRPHLEGNRKRVQNKPGISQDLPDQNPGETGPSHTGRHHSLRPRCRAFNRPA